MGHINKDSISKLQKVVEGISTIKKVNHCLSCAKGKQQRKPFSSGPFEIESIGDLLEGMSVLFFRSIKVP